MGFLNKLFLAAAATALLPILIHLVQRRRVEEVVFGSLRFLRKTSHRVVQRRRFEEFLLVLLRALALAALAAGFARPFFQPAAQARGGGMAFNAEEPAGTAGAALLLIDNSYSMRRPEGRMERAKEEALKLLRQAAFPARAGVAAYSSQFDELCPIGSQPAQLEAAVKGIEPSWRGTKLALALNQASRLLARASPGDGRRAIVMIGDFQDSSWKRADNLTLAPGTELAIRDVGGKTVPNVFVARVAVPRLVVAGGFVEVISASICNLTDKPLNDAQVSLRVSGEVKGTSTVNIRPGEEAPVRFQYKFTEAGDVSGDITVQVEDSLPEDNVAFFCVHVTPRVNVLLVNADHAEKMVLNEGLFLKTALVPPAEGVVSPFQVREIAPEELKPSDLDGVDVVLCANVSKLPAALTRIPPDKHGVEDQEFYSALGRFAAAGGGLGFICGSKVVPEEFNRNFEGLAPCKLSRLAMHEGDSPVVINQIDAQHEVFAEFAQPHCGDLSQAEFSQYFLVTDSLRAQVPARFSNRDAHPALLERVFGQEAGGETEPEGKAKDESKLHPKGKSVLLVSSLNLEWNNLCLKSVFVPFVHQLVKRLCSRRGGGVRNFTVGDEIIHYVQKEQGKATLRFLRSSSGGGGELVRDETVGLLQKSLPSGDSSAVTFVPQKPGLYELAYPGGSARFAVNLDPKEPDLRPMDARLLLAAVQKRPTLEGEAAAHATPLADGLSARERLESSQKVWCYLVFAVLGLLALEMVLATRIGRA